MTAKVRVHELAREFGTTSEAVLRLLHRRGFTVRSASSLVDRYACDWLRFEFTAYWPAPAIPLKLVGSDRDASPPHPVQRPRDFVQDFDWGFVRSWRQRDDFGPATPPRQPRRTSTRAVQAFANSSLAAATLDIAGIEAGLQGSPYSLSPGQFDYMQTTFLPRVAALSLRAEQEQRRVAATRRATLARVLRSSEVYESNRIEGLGPDLQTTDSVLRSSDLHRRVDISVAQNAIQSCLTAEPKIRDVVGLGAARLLAEIYCADRHRALCENDLRQLHELIMIGDPQGGSYKQYVNRIGGSIHEPSAPSDTPAAMMELVSWLRTTKLNPLWRAAVAHAWLTHIHPFHDGNGRVARLLANLVLIRAGMPPAIVRASSDRGAYLDALSASDGGGDILPLARVFRRVLSRAVQDLANPMLAEQIFNAEIERRFVPRKVRWHSMLAEFLSELAPRLLLHRLNLLFVGEVTDAELDRIGSGYPENAWVAKVQAPGRSRDLLLHVAMPSATNRSAMPVQVLTPSVFVSVRNDRPLDARQYLPVGLDGFTHEFTPLIDDNAVLVRRATDTATLPIYQAADRAAESLAETHRQLVGQ